jgi:hypothetical protein
MTIVETILSYLPSKRKTTPSGWTKFNAVCCHQRGYTADTRGRAGIIQNGDGISYHCFNCGYKASFKVGRLINLKMKQLLNWLNVPDDVVAQLSLAALKQQDQEPQTVAEVKLAIQPKFLPEDSQLLVDAVLNTDSAIPVLEYLLSRNFGVDDYPWHWSPAYPDRLIIPFYHNSVVCGWTARKITDGKPKYLSDQTPGYVFNLDRQQDNREFIIVTEGPFDALAVNGVAMLGAELMAQQYQQLKVLGKEIILVPDRDSAGLRTLETILDQDLDIAVSMPHWPHTVKDCAQALALFGRTATMHSIVMAKETNKLKIQLAARTWFKTNNYISNDN